MWSFCFNIFSRRFINFLLSQDINFSSQISNSLGEYTCSWDSNIDGELSTDCSFTTSSLQEGTHQITLTVEDDLSQETQEITIDIKDNLGAEITSPNNNDTFNHNETITLVGTSINSYGDVTCSWSSNQDGPLGEGCSLENISLSENTHIITLKVQDNLETGTDSVTLYVGSLSIFIISPLNNSEHIEGDSISFESSSEYPYQGTHSCSWSSNIDGELSTECSFTKNDLSSGTHEITLEVDDGFNTDSVSINLIINEPPPCSGLPYIEYSGNFLCIHPTGSGTSQWGCRGTSVSPSATSTTNGALNTQNIVSWHEGWESPWETGPNGETCNSSNNGTVAARVCDDLVFGGFDDWYLPANNQLQGMNDQKNNVILGDYSGSWSSYSSQFLWSSTELSSSYAYEFYMIYGNINFTYKSSNYYVRCVRDH